MPTIDYQPFATDVGANVMSQADFLAAAFRLTGFQPGIAQSSQLNKVWRQSAFMAAALAKFISNETGNDVLDNGDLNAMVTLITSAMTVVAAVRPTRLVTVSTPLAVALSDYAVGLNRVAAPAAMPATLPAGAQVGQEFRIEDISANANAFPITVSPPGGHTISGLANWVINTNRSSTGFRFYGSSIWSVVK